MFSEQVLHRVKAEQRSKGRSDEAVCRSCCRKTCQHIDAWVRTLMAIMAVLKWSTPKPVSYIWLETILPLPEQIVVLFCYLLLWHKCLCLSSALLIKAHSMPFQVQPSTMASVVKGLYSLRPGEPLLSSCFPEALACILYIWAILF